MTTAMIWAWICAIGSWTADNPEMTGAAVYAVAELVTRIWPTKDSAGLLKRIGAGIDIALDIVRMPNRLKK